MEPATEGVAMVALGMAVTVLAVWSWMLVREILAVRRSAKKSRQQTITEIQGAQIVAEKHLALLQERVMRLEHRLKSQATFTAMEGRPRPRWDAQQGEEARTPQAKASITRHLC